MKNKRIISINFLIIFLVIFGVILYTNIQGKITYNSAVNGFEITAYNVSKVIESHMTAEQRIVSNWAKLINSNRWSMEEAVTYLKQSISESRTSIHIIWADNMEGISSQPNASNLTDFSVSYRDTQKSHIYEMTPGKVIDSMDLADDGIHMSSAYTNPVTGSKVIAFGQKIRLYDEGKSREAILLYLIPVTGLKEQWVYSTEYPDVHVALIEKNGTYIIQPSGMKNSSFYEFIYSYNQMDQEEISHKIFEESPGSFKALDSYGVQKRFAYLVLSKTNKHAVVIAVPDDYLGNRKTDWSVLIIIIGCLTGTLVANLVYIGTATKKDESQIKRIERQNEQLKFALEKAKEANNSKTIFLNNVSHDIRTPMNAIMGFTNLAFASINDGNKMYDYLMKISTASAHLLELINDVLDMGRIESGKLELVEKETNFYSLFTEIETVFDAEIKNRKLNFKIDTSELKNPNVICDKLRLKQILDNLISNAIKFTNERGSVSLSVIETAGTDEGYSIYEFHVKDNGIGMSPEFAKKIYEPFERERSSTVSGIQGSGLGMAITKNLVNMMHGEINLESHVGAGTEFTVRIAFKINPDAPEIKIEEPAIIDDSKKVNYEGKRVLLVEDNDLNQEIAITILEGMGLTVDLANDGSQAVESIIENETGYYDIVFMDIMMPIMNGFEATKAIRNIDDVDKANVPIIAMTANAFEENKNDAQKAGMDGYVAKPINIENLTKVLQEFLEPIEEL